MSEFNKNAKMVSKSSKHCKTPKQVPEAILMSTFSGRSNFFKDTFHCNGGSCQVYTAFFFFGRLRILEREH